MKKLFCAMLSLILLLAVFASCTTTPVETDNSTESPLVNESNTEGDMMTLFEKGKETDYIVIYADDSNTATISAAQGIVYNLKQKFQIEDLECRQEYADWGMDPEIHEILIGNTTRSESAEARKLLKGAQNEYAILLSDNGKISIVGANQPSTVQGINYFTKTFITNNSSDVLKMEKGYSYYCELGDISNARWTLKAPKYTGGVYAPATYNSGSTVNLTGNNSAKMQLINETNAEEFNAYIEKLVESGYSEVARTENNKNIYVQYAKNTSLVYAYYLENFKEARIIDDYCSDSEAEFEYVYEAKEGETTVYYQYGMMHDPAGGGSGNYSDGKWGNNGAFDIIKLADNKLILIDGGYNIQATPEATKALVDFLHEITGTKSGEKITVAAWYLTHTHEDHLYFVKNLAFDYSDEVVFERIMHNSPYQGGKAFVDCTNKLLENNPDILYAKLHTGQNITLGNINFDVIMTHEDATNPETGRTYIQDQNNTSSILKFNINGKTIMYLGDWGGNDQNTDEHKNEYKNMEKRLLTPYLAEDGSYPALKADIVQIAHHGINDWLGKVYAAVDADYAFFSQADVEYNKLMYPCYKNIIVQLRNSGMEDKNMFFAGRQTNWLTIEQNGKVTHGYKKIEGATAEYWDYIEKYGGKPWYDYENQ